MALTATAANAFNPNEGAEDNTPSPVRMLTGSTVGMASAAPLYAPGTITPSNGYVSHLAPLQMPDKPLYPSHVATAPVFPPVDPAVEAQARMELAANDVQVPAVVREQATTQPTAASAAVITPAPLPVSAPVAVAPAVPEPLAAAVVATPPAATPAAQAAIAQPLAAPASGFIAPAPLLAVAPQDIAQPPAPTPAPAAKLAATPAATPAAPIVAAAPAFRAPVPVATAAPLAPPEATMPPAKELSDQTRTILSHVPSAMDTPKFKAGQKIALDRVSPEIKEVLGQKADEESYEAVGLSIKVRRPGLDTNYELNRAYTALMGGDTQTAIETYKNIISVEPRNEDALFGLAATYHRLGLEEQARPIYGMLLKINPNHREGLNNFLVLVSDESPQDALPELERLEQRNPDFSPIPAQIAIVLDKMGYAERAREKMLRAMELAPDNMSYRYNLAVMLDRQHQYADAAALYRTLIDAAMKGATVPASTEVMQNRLTYLVTEMTSTKTGMAR